MLPLCEFSQKALSKIKFVLTDIDDTITKNGRITSASLLAMEKLQEKEIFVIPITGRPAGWCDHIARMWPIDGIVGENGAFYFVYETAKRKMKRRFLKDIKKRITDRKKLDLLQTKILSNVKGCKLASDQAYREADLAIDFCEDVPKLPKQKIEKIVQLFRLAGANTKVSSIHVNGWFGNYDKLTTTKLIFKEIFQIIVENSQEQIVFCGDSPNDEPLFNFFQNSVGVANVLDYADIIKQLPTWITTKRYSNGFAELADAIIEAHSN